MDLRGAVLIVVVQLLWGCYPVLLRVIQTESSLPSFISLFLIRFSAACLIFPAALPSLRRSSSILLVWILLFFAVIREISVLFAAKFSSAVYIQLIYQTTPIIVAVSNRWLGSTPIPKVFYPSALFLIAGAMMVLLADNNNNNNDDDDDDDDGENNNTAAENALGLSLAVVAALLLAVLYHLNRNIALLTPPIDAPTMMFWQEASVGFFSFFSSFVAAEKWSDLRNADDVAIAAFVVALFIVFFGKLLEIWLLQRYGGPAVSSVLACRIISTILLSWILLQEGLSGALQWTGIVVVAVAVTVYTTTTAGMWDKYIASYWWGATEVGGIGSEREPLLVNNNNNNNNNNNSSDNNKNDDKK